jgi:cyclopropane fatty-acyl-phospholipid synthase-like methyltransferase
VSIYTAVGHRDLSILNPLSGDAFDRAIETLALNRESRVIDFGCGKGDLLRRIVAKFGCHAEGVDISSQFIDEAREALPSGKFVVADASTYRFEPGYDVAACIGATHALGGTTDALNVLTRAVRPHGVVLLGEGYWRKEPEPEYLEATGIRREEMLPLDMTIALAWARKLALRETFVATESDFMRYETAHAKAIAAHGDDAMKLRSRAWHTAFEKWGRSTMGFALFVFEKREL